ncbi:MFS transporter [Cellulomonas edaphi]|uniref:MFS transporter n=1 Tax=Cellulomonas edaphi TaxID=3053468 RepID=A0ABT7S8G1_9CELL|nr:MFS transporter [Cellulomons edaphi]MDM7831902.1 MFS transporter [Cellulomons edaphi]
MTTARRSLIHHPDFRRLWTGDALGQLGAQLTFLALPVFAVEHLDATEWQMGALTAAETAAFLVIGLPAGAWVDRMLKRRVLIVSDLVRATVLAVVVLAALTDHASMPLLIVAGLVISGASVFFDVAHQSYVPGLVGLEHIVEGNSKLQATQSVAQVAAPAVGGALLRVVSAPALIGVNVVTYVVSAVAVWRIKHLEQPPSPESRRPLRTEIAEGMSFVVHQPLLRRIVACTGGSNFASAITNAVFVIYALRTLGLSTPTFGAVMSASAIGGLLGAVTADRLARLIGEARVIPVAAVACVPALAMTPLAGLTGLPPAALMVTGGVTVSFCVVVYNVAQVSFRQRLCPPALLGRMNASVRFIVWGCMPIGGLLGGWLGTHLGVQPTLWIAVGVGALATLPVLLGPFLGMRDLPGTPDEHEPADTEGEPTEVGPAAPDEATVAATSAPDPGTSPVDHA